MYSCHRGIALMSQPTRSRVYSNAFFISPKPSTSFGRFTCVRSRCAPTRRCLQAARQLPEQCLEPRYPFCKTVKKTADSLHPALSTCYPTPRTVLRHLWCSSDTHASRS